MPEQENICIELQAWIIQDGNYGDFTVGDKRFFAIEVYPRSLVAISKWHYDPTPSLKTIERNRYKICGQVFHIGYGLLMLDFGVKGYISLDAPSPEHQNFQVGDWVTGEIELAIDPFSYFEKIGQKDEVPELIYQWTVREIDRDMSPFIHTGENRSSMRDRTKVRIESIKGTNAWKDDDGMASYWLHCELISREPIRITGKHLVL